MGKSRRYVFARMQLRLCPEARDAFRAGALDASTVLLVASIPHARPARSRAVKRSPKGPTTWAPTSSATANAKRLLQVALPAAAGARQLGIADAKLLPEAGACSTCPKRTGNQPELFDEDVPTDTCTDPDCFEAKRIAQVKATGRCAQDRAGGHRGRPGPGSRCPYGPDQTGASVARA